MAKQQISVSEFFNPFSRQVVEWFAVVVACNPDHARLLSDTLQPSPVF